MDLKFEVVVIPVSDVDRAVAFYSGLGWRLDADFTAEEKYRVVQLTPPGSSCSIILGTGLSGAAPGSVQGLHLVASDLGAARDELIERGVAVGEVFHDFTRVFHHAGVEGRVTGPDPDRKSYGSFASFQDPDGNEWVLQEMTERLPGRVSGRDVAGLAQLLHETALHHGSFEAVGPPHDWWDWYAAYLDARERGNSSEEASGVAGRYMSEVKHVVVSPG